MNDTDELPAAAGTGSDAPEPGYRMMTAEIVYVPMPPGCDAAEALANAERIAASRKFVWRDFDSVPNFPRLRRFLDEWLGSGVAVLESVTVTQIGLRPEPACRIAPASGSIN